MSNQTENQYSEFGTVGDIVICGPAFVCNLLIAASIARHKAMHIKKELVILGALAAADAADTLSDFLGALWRVYILASGLQDTKWTSLECLRLPHVMLFSFSRTLSRTMLVIVSLDRFFLVSLRVRYLSFSYGRYLTFMVVLPYSICIILGLYTYFTAIVYGFSEPVLGPMCYGKPSLLSNAYSSIIMGEITTYARTVLPLASVAIFAAVPPIQAHFSNKILPESQQNAQQLKKQKKLTVTVGISCACTFLLSSLSSQMAIFLWYEKKMYLVAWFFFLAVNLNPLANFFIYQIAHQYMRKGLKALIKCQDLPPTLELWNTAQHSVATF